MPDTEQNVNKKIKVMHLIWSMGDGGAQQVIINYLRDFKDDKDIDLQLYVYNKPSSSKYDKEVVENNYNVTYLNNPRSSIKIPIIRYPFNKIVARRTWYKAIKDYNPDIVHVHISGLLDDVLKPIVRAEVPFRFDTLHSNPLRYQGHIRRVINRAFNKYEFIPICLTDEQAKLAKGHYSFTKYEIIRNGIDIETIANMKLLKIEARKRLNILIDTFVILGVGRLTAIKNFSLLVNAFSEVLKVKKDALLVLAGQGEEKDKLAALADSLNVLDKVVFLGNRTDMHVIYSAADVLGMPSISEASPLTLIEAQAIGLRAVISDGVPDESIVTNKVRKMAPNATFEQWAKALLDDGFVGEKVCDIMEYDVHNTSMKLKELYLEHFEK